MPRSRRGSGNHGDLPGINLQGLSIRDRNSATGQAGQLGRHFEEWPGQNIWAYYISTGKRLQLLQSHSYSKCSASSTALDLAPLSQTPPRSPVPNGRLDPSLKSSEWARFSGAPRPSDVGAQPHSRHATNPGPIGGSRPSSGMGRNLSSPTGMPDSSSIINPSVKSVPVTDVRAPESGGDVASFAQEQNGSNMNRLSGTYDIPVTFNSVQANEDNFVGNINGEMTGPPSLQKPRV
ncbi:hypothetical protein FRC10_002756 [Ceratobasidium sp. 414]|nr:hypothetical protein FRC10_002756 [Ceratobasidium sp. 414]